MNPRSFAVLIVEADRARISRFHVQLRGETLWTADPRGLTRRLREARPQFVAVAGEKEVAEALAEQLRASGLARSVFVLSPVETSGRPGPGQVPVLLPQGASLETPEDLLPLLMEALVEAQGRAPMSPLTGLPSSPLLQEAVSARLLSGQPFAFLYLDLDNFKAYNDAYGFGRGDIAISTLGKEVAKGVRIYGGASDLCVHIGGDDFAVLTAPSHAQRVAEAVIAGFSAKVLPLYPPEAQEAGYIETPNRQGVLTRYPLMTLSIGGVDTTQRRVTSYLQLTEIAAEVKAYAKSLSGSRIVMDRRRD